jgi:serine kinase of HPr protein (carbohydrate metabolism regulator)
MIRHAGLIAARGGGRWRGVLLEGPSASGKSDLTLRALSCGFRLVADDRAKVFVSGGLLFGRAPTVTAGLIEVRGQGLAGVTALAFAQIVLLARCVATPEAVERQPAPATTRILGVDIPVLDLWPFEPSAPLKLILALEHLGLTA